MSRRNLAALASALALTSAIPVPTLPPSDVAQPLPPPTGLDLQYITLGHGIQNYTCTAVGTAATSTGALAVLYDVTSLYPGDGSSVTQKQWETLPAQALHTTSIPLNLRRSPPYAATTRPFPKPDHTKIVVDVSKAVLPPVGHHFFDTNGVPTFDLYGFGEGDYFQGKKVGNTSAPAKADPGLISTGAVDWLKMDDKGLGTSRGIDVVYRVLTAGGMPPPCTAVGQQSSVPYAADYFFYAKSS